MSVCNLFFFYFEAVKSFEARRLQGVSRVFQARFKSISRAFQERFKSFQERFERVSRAFQERIKGVSRVFQGGSESLAQHNSKWEQPLKKL